MKCNKCGATLTDSSFCNKCGTNVVIYKKLISASNAFYNRGLEKAQVRDLSGAAEDLRDSLKIYKKNIPARNLLGLVYFEMGDIVSALSEWIVSKNYQPENNVANAYIDDVQKNSGRMESYNTSLKKYNQSLLYAQQGSLDLAVIQLKKVLSLNENFVQAHLLLALVAIETDQMELARKELKKVLHIDRGNTLAISYLGETEQAKSKNSEKRTSKISKDAVTYTSGNETIIQPKSFQENSGRNVVLDILFGFALGIAVCWFVFVPARIQGAKNETNKQIVEYSDQLEAKEAAIDSMKKEMKEMEKQVAAAQEQVQSAEGASDGYAALFEAKKLAGERNFEAAAEELAKVDPETLADGAKEIYNEISGMVNATAVEDLYAKGKNSYNAKNYTDAIANLEKVVGLSPDNADAVYWLAKSYASVDDVENAKKYYARVVEMLPGSTIRAQNAQSFLNAHP